MTRGINELKKITKHISFQGKCKFDQRKCNSNQCWYNDKCLKNMIYEKKIIFGILVHVFVNMENIQQVLWTIQ